MPILYSSDTNQMHAGSWGRSEGNDFFFHQKLPSIFEDTIEQNAIIIKDLKSFGHID